MKEVKFRPRDSNVVLGDEIKCHARGNPTPRIIISPLMTSEVEGPGWKSFRVPDQYEGKDMKVVCSASNTVGDDWETTSINRTFHVAGWSVDVFVTRRLFVQPILSDVNKAASFKAKPWRYYLICRAVL